VGAPTSRRRAGGERAGAEGSRRVRTEALASGPDERPPRRDDRCARTRAHEPAPAGARGARRAGPPRRRHHPARVRAGRRRHRGDRRTGHLRTARRGARGDLARRSGRRDGPLPRRGGARPPQARAAFDHDRPDVLVGDIGAYPARVLAHRWSRPLVQLSRARRPHLADLPAPRNRRPHLAEATASATTPRPLRGPRGVCDDGPVTRLPAEAPCHRCAEAPELRADSAGTAA
jgi:hypothetical protein